MIGIVRRGSYRAVLVGVCLLLGSVGLCGCVFLPPTPSSKSPTSQGVTVSGNPSNSQLTKAGVAKIESDRELHFDLRENQLLKRDVGLTVSDEPPAIEVDDSMRLSLVGSEKTVTVETGFVRFFGFTDRERISSIYYFFSTSNLEEAAKRFENDAKPYGFKNEELKPWVDYSRQRSNEENTYNFSAGTAAGFSVQYTLTYKGSNKPVTFTVTVGLKRDPEIQKRD